MSSSIGIVISCKGFLSTGCRNLLDCRGCEIISFRLKDTELEFDNER